MPPTILNKSLHPIFEINKIYSNAAEFPIAYPILKLAKAFVWCAGGK